LFALGIKPAERWGLCVSGVRLRLAPIKRDREYAIGLPQSCKSGKLASGNAVKVMVLEKILKVLIQNLEIKTVEITGESNSTLLP